MNSAAFQVLADPLGWTLTHSLWQAAIVALICGMATKTVFSPRMRYALNCAGLSVIVLCAILTFISELRDSPRISKLTPVTNRETQIQTVIRPIEISAAEQIPAAEGIPEQSTRWSGIMPSVVVLWAFGVLLMSVRMLFACRWVAHLRRTAVPWGNPEWTNRMQMWLEEFGINRAVQLGTTLVSEVPAVIGHFKPIILIPASILARLTPEQLEAIILHELMHVRRNDYLINLLQHVCETIFFFNPAVWWISRSIRVEREHCCDDLVTNQTGEPLAYANALVRLEELRAFPEESLALAASDGSLKKRISRIIGGNENPSGGAAWTGFATAALLIAGIFGAALPNTVAQNPTNSDGTNTLEMCLVVPEGTPGAESLKLVRSNFTQRLSIKRPAILTSEHIAQVRVEMDPISTNQPQIMVRLDSEGKRIFEKFTRDNIGRQIAILIDGTIMSAPVINGAISGGKFVISGDFSREKAAALANRIKPDSQVEIIQWSQGSGTLLSEAEKDEREDRYPEALEKYFSYFTASRYEPGQGGVRLSFALSHWLRLGQKYPPALQKLKDLRDNTGDELRNSEKTADYFTLFQEYGALNKTLRDEGKTSEMFLWFDQNDPEVAQQLFRVARPALIKAGLYRTCAKYIRASDFDDILLSFQATKKIVEKHPSMANFANKRFQNSTATLVALLVVNGDKPSAEKVAGQALKESDDPELKKLLDAALNGEVPPPWP